LALFLNTETSKQAHVVALIPVSIDTPPPTLEKKQVLSLSTTTTTNTYDDDNNRLLGTIVIKVHAQHVEHWRCVVQHLVVGYRQTAAARTEIASIERAQRRIVDDLRIPQKHLISQRQSITQIAQFKQQMVITVASATAY
jgi:hypothetical protein